MKSMTGFGRGKQHKGEMTILTEIQSVNRKNLEISVSLPKDYQSLEIQVHAWVKAHVGRGKINVSIQIQDHSTQSGLTIDEAYLETAIHKLKAFSQSTDISFDLDTSDVIRLISMNKGNHFTEPKLETVTPLLEKALQDALKELNTMRLNEGKHLNSDIKHRIAELSNKLDSVSQLAPNVTPRYKSQLEERLKNLGQPIDLDDERLLKELAFFADKSDISEEITRLKSHFNQFSNDLNSEGIIGRKLDFLCQEINREWNTIGSKANFLEITQIVIDAKNELERVREQVQNIE